MEILDKAYDNPAVSILTYVALPGVPMDFLNATARASWGFIRNQDDRYGVKVVAEEAISLKWQVDEYGYSVPGSFRRLKELGFETREDLARFIEFLPALVEVTDYDLEDHRALLNAAEPPLAGPGASRSRAQGDRARLDGRHARILQRVELLHLARRRATRLRAFGAELPPGATLAPRQLRAARPFRLRDTHRRAHRLHIAPPRAGRRAGLRRRAHGGQAHP
jgi:hypothetical protein